MKQLNTLRNIFTKLPVGIGKKDKKNMSPPKCPQCHYVLDRPHAFRCSRCMSEIPQAQGCSGCGKCQKKQ